MISVTLHQLLAINISLYITSNMTPHMCISPISPPISNIKTPIRYDPNILEPCMYIQFENKCHTDSYQNTYQIQNRFILNNLAFSKIYVQISHIGLLNFWRNVFNSDSMTIISAACSFLCRIVSNKVWLSPTVLKKVIFHLGICCFISDDMVTVGISN